MIDSRVASYDRSDRFLNSDTTNLNIMAAPNTSDHTINYSTCKLESPLLI